MTKAYKGVVILLAVLLATSILWASFGHDLTLSLLEIFKGDWIVVSLLDVYLGFTLFAFVIYYFEKSKLHYAPWKPTLWILALMALGNVIGAIYLLFHFQEIKDRLLGNKS